MSPRDPLHPALYQALRYLDGKVSLVVHRFHLIQDGDHILVAVSGGKDSWCLLEVLAARRSWALQEYRLTACHVVNPGCTSGAQLEALERRCQQLGLPLVTVPRDAPVPQGTTERGEKSPSCFHCAWDRRRLLFQAADRCGCGKVALGHQMDDLVETFLMNLLFHGELSTMAPSRTFFAEKLTVIRPLVLVEEKTLRRLSRLTDCPQASVRCPAGSRGQRARIKQLLAEVSAGNRAVKRNLLRLALATIPSSPGLEGVPGSDEDDDSTSGGIP